MINSYNSRISAGCEHSTDIIRVGQDPCDPDKQRSQTMLENMLWLWVIIGAAGVIARVLYWWFKHKYKTL